MLSDNVQADSEKLEQPGGFISEIKFNTSKSLPVDKDSIVVFVGPNNAGKSQALKDIFTLCEKTIPTKVVSEIKITKSHQRISTILENISTPNNQGRYTQYIVFEKIYPIFKNTDEEFERQPTYGNMRDLFAAFLDTSARLKICEPPKNITAESPKSHPIHFARFNTNCREWLSSNFKKAFGKDLTPDSQFGETIPLRIGPRVRLEESFEDEQLRQDAYSKILSGYDQVQNQGDGIKSFTGILLYLMLKHYRTFLIDEPESFLHPPQARIMGQIIGESLSSSQQCFISTHSEDIIKGLISICPSRVKIVRITRTDNNNTFSCLGSENLQDIWSDPLLRHSNIMSSLFHKTVVLCESDSDCKIYSIIDNHLKQKENTYSETLFIQCNGKHRMAKTISSLRSLSVNVKLITDADVLDDVHIIQNIAKSFDINWDEIKDYYKTIESNLSNQDKKPKRSIARTEINEILSKSNEEYISNSESAKIKKLLSSPSKWDSVKKHGASGIPQGNASYAYQKMNAILRDKGIFIVPVGELECFVRDIGGHGPEWVNQLLEHHPDLEDEHYKEIKEFIRSMKL